MQARRRSVRRAPDQATPAFTKETMDVASKVGRAMAARLVSALVHEVDTGTCGAFGADLLAGLSAFPNCYATDLLQFRRATSSRSCEKINVFSDVEMLFDEGGQPMCFHVASGHFASPGRSDQLSCIIFAVMKEDESMIKYERKDFVETDPLHFNIELGDRPPILVGALESCAEILLPR